MVTDLAAMLRERRDDARRRKEGSRQSMLSAEEDEKKWQAALDLELRSHQANSNGSGINGDVSRDSVSPDSDLLSSPRVKYEIFMKRLREAGRPMRTSELIKAIPEVSERYIYYLVSHLKRKGEIEVDKATKGVKPTQNGSAVKAERPENGDFAGTVSGRDSTRKEEPVSPNL